MSSFWNIINYNIHGRLSVIIEQTMQNAKPSIDGLASTLAGAGKTTLDHFTGGDKQN